MTRPDTQVLIVGGGLAGAVLAGLLAGEGIESIVLEARAKPESSPDPSPDPRALALTPASKRILEASSAWQQLPARRIGRFEGMQVWDANGSGHIQFDSADLCQPTLGYIVEQSQLHSALHRALAGMAKVKLRYGVSVDSFASHAAGMDVQLDTGERLSTLLLVGADGQQSRVRRLAGIKSESRDYQQDALACVVETALAHDHVARQRFMHTGPLAFLPMYEDRQCGVVWSCTPAQAERLLSMPEDEFNRELGEAFEHSLGDILCSASRTRFPLRRAQATHYCRERLVLLGDAAHSVHPLAGQGANLGLLDAASLAQLMLEAKNRGRNIAARRVLRGYERWRKQENRIMMMTLEGFKYAFENQARPLPMLRNRALELADSIIPLKHTIMRHAMGLSGDLPDIAKARLA